MKHHEIECIGKFWAQKTAGVPTWAAKDEGRLLYDDTGNLLYYGNNTAFKRIAIGDESTFAVKSVDNSWSATQCPYTDNTYALGQPSTRWSNVYATTFTGTVTTATYADLAEMYKTPIKYTVGTIVKISDNPEFDICMADEKDEDVLGVISSKPGFILNHTNAEGMQPVGLVGRVPVRVIGPIKKAQAIMCAGNGQAKAYDGKNSATKIGHALESNTETGEKLVECSIK